MTTKPSPAGQAQKLGRGRPSSEEVAAISNAIMAVATESFLTEGYEHASMEAIAARAGVRKTTLYRRFPDKRSLLRAVLNERRVAWSSAQQNVELKGDLEQRLKHHCTTMLVWAMTPEIRAFISLTGSAWRGAEEARIRQEVIGYTEMVDRLEQEIRDHSADLDIHAADPRAVVTTLMATLTGWVELRVPNAETDKDDAVRFAHKAVDLLLQGRRAW